MFIVARAEFLLSAFYFVVSHGVLLEELTDDGQNLLTFILQHQVTGVGETVNLGIRQQLLPDRQKVMIKHEVLFSP